MFVTLGWGTSKIFQSHRAGDWWGNSECLPQPWLRRRGTRDYQENIMFLASKDISVWQPVPLRQNLSYQSYRHLSQFRSLRNSYDPFDYVSQNELKWFFFVWTACNSKQGRVACRPNAVVAGCCVCPARPGGSPPTATSKVCAALLCLFGSAKRRLRWRRRGGGTQTQQQQSATDSFQFENRAICSAFCRSQPWLPQHEKSMLPLRAGTSQHNTPAFWQFAKSLLHDWLHLHKNFFLAVRKNFLFQEKNSWDKNFLLKNPLFAAKVEFT